jgi:hypothetical protein
MLTTRTGGIVACRQFIDDTPHGLPVCLQLAGVADIVAGALDELMVVTPGVMGGLATQPGLDLPVLAASITGLSSFEGSQDDWRQLLSHVNDVFDAIVDKYALLKVGY